MGKGRPVTVYTPEKLKEIADKLEKYINETPLPIIAEFCYKNDLVRCSLYEYEELVTLIKKLSDKKQSYLEKMALSGDVNTAMAIFSLKQMGWSDKQEIKQEVTVDVSEELKTGLQSLIEKYNNK